MAQICEGLKGPLSNQTLFGSKQNHVWCLHGFATKVNQIEVCIKFLKIVATWYLEVSY
jgi:hypothetical protein